MKKTLVMILSLTLLVSLSTAIFASDNTNAKVSINGKEQVFNVDPIIKSGRVMVPARNIFEALGTQVQWKNNSKEVFAKKGAKEIKLKPTIINNKSFVPLRVIAESFGVNVAWDNKNKLVSIKGNLHDISLPTVASYQNLKILLSDYEKRQSNANIYRMNIMKTKASVTEQAFEAAPPGAPASEGKADYSSTNVQVQDVDEADIVKTDGKYIYQVNKRKIVIAQAYPTDKMAIINTVKFTEQNFEPSEIYVDAKHLVVIGYDYYPTVQNVTKAIIYDISNKKSIKKLRVVELEGSYVSSRKIGSTLYLVANKYIDYYNILKSEETIATPKYRDSIKGKTFTDIKYADIRYFPKSIEPNYLMVAGIDLEQTKEEVKVSTYLGSGHNIYASQNNLYIAATIYEEPISTEKIAILPRNNFQQQNTIIYKFSYNNGKVIFQGKGQVSGNILNQFSMDEHNGNFRIATTKGYIWRNDESTSKNNLYILNNELNTIGKIENIAPGERIYSVRFMGDRAYIVTFKTVDPLFVLDLKDARAPKILGALKIPGYSDYLHPYDENHIIGFGKDTIEISQKDLDGNPQRTMAFYQGMKLAIFDVTDVTKPKEKFKTIIGDRGTDSELLRNHKALLFSKEKSLLAFPVTVMQVKSKQPANGDFPEYGEFTYQGAYVYDIDLQHGFRLKGKITHLSQEELNKAGHDWYNSDRNIERLLYINNSLFTLSKGLIKANDLNTLTPQNELILP